MKPIEKPYIITFRQIGDPSEGYISVAEFEDDLPFEVKRTFWTYFTPQDVVRGRHAHHRTEMVLIAASGRIEVTTEIPGGEKDRFVLERPEQGVYLPRMCWHTMRYSHTAVQLVLASTAYDPGDYIRDYEEFLEAGKKGGE